MAARAGFLTVVLLAVLLGAGCSHRYVITTTNGLKLVTATKPKRVDDWYVYRDATGTNVQINAMRVRVIEPYSKKAAGVGVKVPEIR